MKLYTAKYISTIYIDVEGKNEEDALGEADRILFNMNGADFRECCDFESIEFQCNAKFSSEAI